MDEAMEDFWQWFATGAKLARTGPTSLLVDQIYEAIIKIDTRLAVEVSEPDLQGDRDLVISARGYPDLIDLVERLVRVAPVIDGWRWVALKPAQGFDFIYRSEGLELRPIDWFFLPLRDQENALGLRIFVPGEPARIGLTMLQTILETGIGERRFSMVRELQYTQSAEDLDRDSWLALTDLAAFLDWQSMSNER